MRPTAFAHGCVTAAADRVAVIEHVIGIQTGRGSRLHRDLQWRVAGLAVGEMISRSQSGSRETDV